MSDDYLWDRSGEPDPEMVKLEEALGKLRHQPKAAQLAQVAPMVRRPFFPALAAAAVILLVLASGLWLALRRSINEEKNSPRVLIANPTPDLLAGKGPTETLNNQAVKGTGTDQPSATITPIQDTGKDAPRRAMGEARLARNASRRLTPRGQERDVMREGEEATEKLMMALRFASSKLNLVQKKMQVNKEGGPAS